MKPSLFVALQLSWALLLTLTAGCGPKSTETSTPAPPPPAAPGRLVETMNRGVSLMGQYQYDAAAQAFEEALKIAPDLEDARFNYAVAAFNRNRKEDLDLGMRLLEEILDKNPGSARALYFKAIILQHIGKAEEAVGCLEKVLAQRPGDGAAWYLLALCKQRSGLPAEKEFLKAVEFRPYLFSAYYQLYQTSIRAGDETNAQHYLERFTQLRESPLGESIELPQYNQMGELALVHPLPAQANPPVARSRYSAANPSILYSWTATAAANNVPISGLAIGDLNGDGKDDLLLPIPGQPPVLLSARAPGQWSATALATGAGAIAASIGDFDNDLAPDLFLAGPKPALLKGQGEGSFKDVTTSAGLASTADSDSGLFVDADHDGDLDLVIANANGAELWLNRGDLTFTNTPLAGDIPGATLIAGGDIDQDRDADLVVARRSETAQVFRNELFGRYAPTAAALGEVNAAKGLILQDFNGDGLLDAISLDAAGHSLTLHTGSGTGSFTPHAPFDAVSAAAISRGPLLGFRAADLDLDGDLDLVVFSAAALHALLNDGRGNFVLQADLYVPASGSRLLAAEVGDLNAELVPDLLVIESGTSNRLVLIEGRLSPPSSAVAVQPVGIHNRDGRTRSPAIAYGTALLTRSGLREHRRWYTGQSGGPNQSSAPILLGLDGAAKIDYLGMIWPDGVAQTEIGLAAGQGHKISELQRKLSSCPVLFAWDGTRFNFVTDFAGVGGLGYLAAPGSYAPPQVLEHVKIEPRQLRPREGIYELRVTEPMEEAAYVDRLELLAIDHPPEFQVFPDERLAITGPPPTHELLVVQTPVFPVSARDPDGRECAGQLQSVDRLYAYQPRLDRRYLGFCRPHTLELDFGAALSGFAPGDRVFLFINGFLEYPYSQTVYAASQSRLGWEPIRVDALQPDGSWATIIPDAGAPGGMGRTMTIDLSPHLKPGLGRLRLTTNLELYYDQIFAARDAGTDRVKVHTLPLVEANLRRVGFAREFSPDGRQPLIYDYHLSDASAPFRVLQGAYTRYGRVDALLSRHDDQFAIMGPGDEIALKFEGGGAPVPTGFERSFILVSHAYCKDMDLYTGTPRTLDPLPFRSMSTYPYAAPEAYPRTPGNQAYLREYNTRIVK